MEAIWVGRKPDYVGHSGGLVKSLGNEVFEADLTEVTFGNAAWSKEKHRGHIVTIRLKKVWDSSIKFKTIENDRLPKFEDIDEVLAWCVQHITPKMGSEFLAKFLNSIYNAGLKDGKERMQSDIHKLLRI